MNDNPATAKKAKKGNLFQRFSASLRVQYSATTILMAVVPLVIVAAALGTLVSRQVRAAMTEDAFNHLTSVRESRTSEIESYFEERERDMITLAESTHVLLRDALDHVTAVREIKQSQVEDYFQTTFGMVHALKDNPTTARAIGDLEAAFMAEGQRTGGRRWRAAYEEFNPVFQDANVDFGFDDILFISADGDVVYTVSGGDDPSTGSGQALGEDVLLGDLKDSGLGRVFGRAMAGEQEIVFEDFAPYAPLGDEPAAFVAGAVENITGTVVGVVAIQLPATKLNAIVQQHAGLTETGETFLVAQEPDGRITFRNDRLTVGGGKFVIGYDLSDIAPRSVRNALSGETDTEIFIGGTGLHMLASHAPVNVGVAGLNWAIVSRMLLEDAIIPQIPGEEQDYLQRYAETRGYPDLYLFSSDGFLFYSVAHEPDYHTNLLTGPYKDSNLGRLLAEIVESPGVDISDFAPYAPIQDAPAAFVAAPVMRGDEVELIVAARLPLAQISAVMQAGAGLGESGETYLVGIDKMWRSDSRFLDQLEVESTILNTETPVRTEASLSALAHESGTRIIENYRGVRVLSSWEPLVLDEPDSGDPHGVVWAVIAEIDESEALAAVNTTTAFITTLSLSLLGVMAVVAAVVGSLIAGRLVKPIVGLTDSATTIAGGDLDVVIPPARSKSEVGVLTNAFATMTTRLRETVGSLRETAENLAERTRELEASQRVTFAASERTSPDELLGLVVDLVRDQFDLYHAQVYIVDEEQNTAVLRQSTGYAGSQLLQRKHQIPLDRTSLVTRAIHTGKPVLVDDTSADPNHMPNPLLPETRSELVVPLKIGEQVIGVLDAQDIEPGRFGESTVALFQTMADQIAFLFENSDLLARVTEQTEALTVFTTQLRIAADIARQAGGILDPEQLLQQVVELMQSRFGLYHAHIYVLDEVEVEGKVEGGQCLVIRAGSGEVGRVLREEGHAIPLDREKSLVARAARTQEPVLVADTTLESDFMPNPLLPQTRSELSVPLVAGGRVLGVLDMQDDQAGRFSESDVDTFTTLAGQIATALQNASLFEAQQESEKRFRDVALSTSDWMWEVDAEGRYTYVSDKIVDSLGYTAEEMLGKTPFDVMVPEEAARTGPIFGELVANKQPIVDLENWNVTKDGREVCMLTDGVPLLDQEGNLIGYRGVDKDITERKQVEAERERFTTQLRTAADLAERVNAILDPDELLREVVTQLQDRFGLYHVHAYLLDEPVHELLMQAEPGQVARLMSQRELIIHAGSGEVGEQLLEQRHSIPLDRERSLVARAVRSRKIVSVEDTSLEPDFMPNPLLPETRSEVAVPLVFGDRVLGVLDVQDNQVGRFTQADLDVFSTLAGQIATALQNAAYFEETQVVAERLEEVNQIKSEFMADMSHELRTPLNSIIGYAELMLMGISEMDPDTLEDVQAIYDNGRHLLKIINDILDLSKIEAGRMELNIEEVYVEPLLDELRTTNAGLLIDKPIEVLVEVEKDLPPIEADRVRVSQVVNNLIGNAIKFTEEGSITLRGYGADEPGWICIEVEDTGVGMDEDDLQEIFERYRQVGDVGERAKGTGLGLSITRHLLRMHGGVVDVRSQLGQGSAFTVRLPVKQPGDGGSKD